MRKPWSAYCDDDDPWAAAGTVEMVEREASKVQNNGEKLRM